ncbi:hypothetical protein KIN20_031584 [Parelaphostrongylus tenuis]|uniref:Uncharacterized protein n=1 Tax=Parelaphostrongylus tenuis TaxID=148309 RepID=A0AAD5WGW8_PARTN|nr:hypothetical protein KIN20_031584 [Parelaphostrongylus tenuis]
MNEVKVPDKRASMTEVECEKSMYEHFVSGSPAKNKTSDRPASAELAKEEGQVCVGLLAGYQVLLFPSHIFRIIFKKGRGL